MNPPSVSIGDRFCVWVKPRTAIDSLTWDTDHLVVKTRKAPVDDHANEAVVGLFKSTLNWRVQIVGGLRNRKKWVEVCQVGMVGKKMA